MSKPPSEPSGPGFKGAVGSETPPGGKPHPPRPLPHVPDHELLDLIGSGSYGEVWLARNVVGSLRAVKVVYRQNFSEAHPFEREFKGVQRFEPVSRSHEGLMDILQIGRNDEAGYFYCVMELADDSSAECGKTSEEFRTDHAGREARTAESGVPNDAIPNSAFSIPQSPGPTAHTYVPHTLRQDLKQRGRLPPAECVRVGLALSSGLEHLHAQGLVHRDIKPSNIIFVEGAPKLADIGLVADLREAHSFVGTEGFIPPEGPGTPQADVYSLGKVLYEMVTGQDRGQYPELPADLKDWPEAEAVLELNQVILKACDDVPGQRYQSAGQMYRELLLIEEGRSVQRRRQAKALWSAGLRWSAIVAAGVVGVWLASSPAKRKPAPPAAVGAEKTSIFVLPFRSTKRNGADLGQLNRITDAFIDSLGLVKGVRVGPRKSGWVCREEATLRALVRTNFHVGHVLTGKVGTPPGQLVIQLTLYQAEGDRVLWTETLTGNTNEAITLERRGLERVATTLGLKVTEEEQRQMDGKLTNNLEAFLLVRQAEGLLEPFTREALLKVMNLYYRALELDPLYLDAENRAGYIHRHLAINRAPKETWTILRHRARRVLEVDDTHLGARYSLWAVTHAYDWDWEKSDAMAVEWIAESSRLEPGGVDWSSLAAYNMYLGRFELSAPAWAKAMEIAPKLFDQANVRTDWLAFLWVTRRYEEGLRSAIDGVKVLPGNWSMYYWIAAHATGKGDYGQAIDAVHKALEIENHTHLQGQLGYAYGRMGDRPKAVEVLRTLEAMSKERYVQPYVVARVHAALGEKDAVFHWLEKAVEDRCEELILVSWGGLMADPAWDGLRDDPRFSELRKKTGLEIWPKPTKTAPKELLDLVTNTPGALPFSSTNTKAANFSNRFDRALLGR